MNLHVFKPALVNSQSDYKNWLSRTVDENKACTHSDNLIELCELVVSILLLWVHRCSINNFKAISPSHEYKHQQPSYNRRYQYCREDIWTKHWCIKRDNLSQTHSSCQFPKELVTKYEGEWTCIYYDHISEYSILHGIMD